MRYHIQELEKKLFGIEKEDGFFKTLNQAPESKVESANKDSMLKKIRGFLGLSI